MMVSRATSRVDWRSQGAAALAILSLNFAGYVSAATPANNEGLAVSEEPKYLIFWWPPEKAGELAETIGIKGNGQTRLLGFGLPTSTLAIEEQLPNRIRSAFAAAREHDMAVIVHI